MTATRGQAWWPVVGGPADGSHFGYPPFEMVPGRVVRVGGEAGGEYRVSADGTRVEWVTVVEG